MAVTTDRRERCEGCDEPFDPEDLTTVEMEYGGTERLCQSCIRQSWSIIASTD